MKLKYQMEILDIDGSPTAVPIDSGNEFRGILNMNGITRDILEILKNDVTEDEIVAALLEEYDATEEQMRHGVRKVITVLNENKLLCD